MQIPTVGLKMQRTKGELKQRFYLFADQTQMECWNPWLPVSSFTIRMAKSIQVSREEKTPSYTLQSTQQSVTASLAKTSVWELSVHWSCQPLSRQMMEIGKCYSCNTWQEKELLPMVSLISYTHSIPQQIQKKKLKPWKMVFIEGHLPWIWARKILEVTEPQQLVCCFKPKEISMGEWGFTGPDGACAKLPMQFGFSCVLGGVRTAFGSCEQSTISTE